MNKNLSKEQQKAMLIAVATASGVRQASYLTDKLDILDAAIDRENNEMDMTPEVLGAMSDLFKVRDDLSMLFFVMEQDMLSAMKLTLGAIYGMNPTEEEMSEMVPFCMDHIHKTIQEIVELNKVEPIARKMAKEMGIPDEVVDIIEAAVKDAAGKPFSRDEADKLTEKLDEADPDRHNRN